MKSKHATKTIMITVAIIFIGGTIAFAHGGWDYGGYGNHRGGFGGHMMGPGNWGGPMMGYGHGWGKGYGPEGLSEEQAAKLEEVRERFYYDTKELRRKINDLRIDLRDEMAKDDPDSGKLANIQKALSKSQADFDQKALAHHLEMRKLAPEGFRGRGYGRGGGNCWR